MVLPARRYPARRDRVLTNRSRREPAEGVDTVNTYDPMDRITYRHMDQQPGLHSAPTPSSPTVDRLPSGYANRSPRTYLGRTRRAPRGA